MIGPGSRYLMLLAIYLCLGELARALVFTAPYPPIGKICIFTFRVPLRYGHCISSLGWMQCAGLLLPSCVQCRVSSTRSLLRGHEILPLYVEAPAGSLTSLFNPIKAPSSPVLNTPLINVERILQGQQQQQPLQQQQQQQLAQPPLYAEAIPGSIRSLPLDPGLRSAADRLPPYQTFSPRQSQSSAFSCSDVAAKGQTTPWGLQALQATPSALAEQGTPAGLKRTYSNRVAMMVCIIAEGGLGEHRDLKGVSTAGCPKEDPVDPGGCALSAFKAAPEGRDITTAAAGIIAAQNNDQDVVGVIPNVGEIYVVNVVDSEGAIEQGTSASARSRLRAYTACEGRFRGVVANSKGETTWRLVMLPLITSPNAVQPVKDTHGKDESWELYPSEDAWVKTATSRPEQDVLIVAPAVPNAPEGAGQAASYPAALQQGGAVLPVLPVTCRNELLSASYPISTTRWAVAAPGQDVLSLSPGNKLSKKSGSFVAAAYVAGVAARLWQSYPMCSNNQLIDVLRGSGKPVQKLPVGSSPVRMLQLKAAAALLEKQPCAKLEPPVKQEQYFGGDDGAGLLSRTGH